jgi:hypothetical protein
LTGTDADRFNAVLAVLDTYFDGLYFSDTARLRQVFHPSATYAAIVDGALLHRTMDAYFPIVDRREAPAARHEQRRDRVAAIDFAGPTTALARVHCAIGSNAYVDLLSLLWIDGRWQIVAKVFHAEPLAP